MLDRFILPLGLFLAKTVILVVAFVAAAGGIARAARALRQSPDERLEVTHVNERLAELAQSLRDGMVAPQQRGWRERRRRRRERKAAIDKASRPAGGRRVFVLDFRGDVAASAVSTLREEVTAILQVAAEHDEVLVRLESPGGVVHGYGLAASELRRVRERGLQLTVCVDKVAASGGYMMACVAQQILAAPFAVIGSIGVVGQLPNFNRWLKKREIDYELHTAGPFKRTLTLLGENNEAGRAKFVAELEETLVLFKAFVSENRPQVAIDEVATGEHWYGRRALELKLVDGLKTSDDYLLECAREREVYAVRYVAPEGLRDWLSRQLSRLAMAALH